MQKLPFQGGRVELTLLLELLKEPGLDESATPCHHCYAFMLAHAPGHLQAAAAVATKQLAHARVTCLCVCLYQQLQLL